MKKRVIISEISHEEMVDLFSTATYGSDWLDIITNTKYGAIIPSQIEEIEKEYEERGETYCLEDKWADVLLNGGTIIAIDCNETDDKGEMGKEYPITYKSLLKGLNRAYNKCADSMHLVEQFDGSADYYDANNVMQVIMFGDVIYG